MTRLCTGHNSGDHCGKIQLHFWRNTMVDTLDRVTEFIQQTPQYKEFLEATQDPDLKIRLVTFAWESQHETFKKLVESLEMLFGYVADLTSMERFSPTNFWTDWTMQVRVSQVHKGTIFVCLMDYQEEEYRQALRDVIDKFSTNIAFLTKDLPE